MPVSNKRLADFLRYLSKGTIGEDDFTKRVDRAVRFIKQKPEWRRSRMKLERYLEEQRIKAQKEGHELGRKEGLQEGRQEERALLAELSTRLSAAGRIDELPAALADDQLFDRLVAEFGLAHAPAKPC